MTDYTKLTDFAAKDALLSGNPSKVVKGTELGAEFDAIETAIATKVDGAVIAAATEKTTPVDADMFPISDSAAANALKKLTWANLKATIKAYYDSVTSTLTNKTVNLTSNTLTGTTAQFNTALSDGDFATLAGTETLTNKTLTSPTITGTGAIAAATITTSGNATLGDAEATDIHAIKGATTLLANSASAALTVTQTGAGNAFVVEDSTSPDSTPFVIDTVGAMIVGDIASSTFPAGDGSAQSVRAQVKGSLFASSALAAALYNNSAPGSGGTLSLAKSNTNTIGGHTLVANNDGLGSLFFSGSDGTQFIRGAQILAQVDGTPGTNDMPGRLIFSTTADGASSPTERMRIDSAGNVGIGGTAPTGWNFLMGKNISGASSSYGIVQSSAVLSGVTNAFVFNTNCSVEDAAFTLTALSHYRASQGTKGAAATVTNQYGYIAETTLTGATNNYGFYSNIASGANRYNFYAAGTADNYFAGAVGIGGTAFAGSNFRINKTVTGSSTSYSTYIDGAIQSDVTSSANLVNTVAVQTAGTLTSLRHFQAEQSTLAGTVTNQFGFVAAGNLTGATNNYGFYSNIASAANRYGFYAAGSAPNYMAGALEVAGALTTGGVEVGYKNIPQNSQSAAYTLVLTDAGKHILHPSADTTARIFTIPANSSVAFPIGTAVTFVNQNAAGVVTISITTDTMRLAGAGTTGSRTLVANGVATAIKLTATEWIISGTGLT